MNRQVVKSSCIKSVGYDLELKILEVELRSGEVYQYSGVPEKVRNALMEAPSLGRFFNCNIRKAYPSKLVEK